MTIEKTTNFPTLYQLDVDSQHGGKAQMVFLSLKMFWFSTDSISRLSGLFCCFTDGFLSFRTILLLYGWISQFQDYSAALRMDFSVSGLLSCFSDGIAQY